MDINLVSADLNGQKPMIATVGERTCHQTDCAFKRSDCTYNRVSSCPKYGFKR